jgi:HK97 family phage portal protein
MGLLGRLANAFRNKSDDAVGSELMEWGWQRSSAGVHVNSLTALQHVAVMSCVSILSEDVAKLPLEIFRRLDNGGKRPAKDHYLYKLLRRPNAWQTRFEFVEMMQAALVLRSNAYAVILRDGRGNPTGLVPLHPDRVTLFEAPGIDYFFAVTRQGLHETAVLAGMPFLIAAEDMLHIRWLSSWSSLLGTSRIGLIREAVGLAMSQEQHQANFAANGARPSGVMQSDKKLSKEVIDRLIEAWKTDQGGARNSGKTRVLEEGLKWQPLTMSMVDAEFLEARRFSVEDIGRAFRVPLYKLGVPSEGQGTAMIQQDQEYLNNVVSSYCNRWTTKCEMTFGLDEDDDLFLEFDYSHFLKADIQTRFTAYRQAVGGPWMTVDEARRAEGLPITKGGDVVLQAANMVPLGTDLKDMKLGGAGPGSDTTGTPAEGGDGDANRLPGDDPAPSN